MPPYYDDEESQYQKISSPDQSESPLTPAGAGLPRLFDWAKAGSYQFHYHGMVRGDEKALFRDCIYEPRCVT